METRLKGKTAIVTGASRGIGRAIAFRLAAEGAQTVLCARDANLLEQAVRAIIRDGGRASALGVDLREMDAAKRVVDSTIATYGRIDIIVNNAGATKRGEFLQLTDEDWADGFALKFFGAMRLTREAWTHLQKQAGSVLNISGVGGRMPGPQFTIGGSVNAALLSFTKAMADIGIRDGIQVNAINPGSIRTDRFRRMLETAAAQQGTDVETAERKLIESARTTRIGEPEDIAALVAFAPTISSRNVLELAVEVVVWTATFWMTVQFKLQYGLNVSYLTFLPPLAFTLFRGMRLAVLALAANAVIATTLWYQLHWEQALSAGDFRLLIAIYSLTILVLAAVVDERERDRGQVEKLSKAEAALRESDERLRASEARLIEAQHLANVGSWERHIQSDKIYWSDEIFRILGLTKGAPPNFPTFLTSVHPKDREKILGPDERVRSSIAPVEVEYRIIRPDGEVRFVRSIVQGIRDDQGVPVRITGATQDITEQVQARSFCARANNV
jgi:PAS domain S-box-containing protein